MTLTPDDEMAAIQTVFEALDPLDKEAQVRVIGYIQSRLGVAGPKPAVASAAEADVDEDAEVRAIKNRQRDAPKFGSFAELFDAFQPTTNAEYVLAAGYWLQVCEGADSFDGQTANTELKNLGHGVGNITNAVDALKNQKPALALQLKKSGTSQQARKTYKITIAGIKAVEAKVCG